jgi:YidC/Oxa1 family membrane protein insertase
VKELSTETRLLIATVLSVGVIAVWSQLYQPPAPPKMPAAPGQTQPGAPASANSSAKPGPGGAAVAPSEASETVPSAPAPRAAAAESSLVVENDLYRVSFSNRGGVVRSWELKKETDDKGKILDLVHPAASEQLGAWPLSLTLDDPQAEAAVNGALYTMTPESAGTIHSPAAIEFDWSDGKTAVIKKLKFGADYIVEL